MRENELIVFTDFEDSGILDDVSYLMDEMVHPRGGRNENPKTIAYRVVKNLIELASQYGFYGNLWHCYLTNLLVNNENPFSTACEIRGAVHGTINEAALHDIEIFKELFDFDLQQLKNQLCIPEFDLILSYQSTVGGSKVYNSRICERICDLALKLKESATAAEMMATLVAFYKDYGVGKFGLHKSFRVRHDETGVHIEPIMNIAHVYLEDIIGYADAKKKLIDNTEAFVAGRKANNCLLFGDAGTGKSSCIKGIANAYYEKGLRIIEIYKHQFQDLNEVIAQIKNRNYKFIIYMDDLSFEEFEIEYKYLKAVIEGGLEKKPQNVLIYATSNRRHLVREKFADKEDRVDDLHKGDTVAEKLSLVARFGVTIYFGSPTPNEFKEIVLGLAQRNNITMPQEQLLLEANKWELAHGGLSGRCAQQFIDYIQGSVIFEE